MSKLYIKLMMIERRLVTYYYFERTIFDRDFICVGCMCFVMAITVKKRGILIEIAPVQIYWYNEISYLQLALFPLLFI